MDIRIRLEEVRDLIADKQHWCQGKYFADEYDRVTTIYTAVKFCATGACYKIGQSKSYQLVDFLMSFLPREENSLIHFNDAATHAKVIALFDRAIAKAP